MPLSMYMTDWNWNNKEFRCGICRKWKTIAYGVRDNETNELLHYECVRCHNLVGHQDDQLIGGEEE